MTYSVPSPLPEAPLSVNFKVSEAPDSPMFTIRAASATELEHLAADAAQHGAAIGRYLVEFRAGLLAGVGVQAPQAAPAAASAAQPAYQPQPAQPAYQAPPRGAQAPQTGATGAAPSCPHGVKEYKTGVNKQGRPYKAWFCPSQDKNNQCKPEWLS
jgi:hypothetical protein